MGYYGGYGRYGGYYGFDWTYLLVIVGVIITAIASSHVTSVYKRYAGIRAASGLTGAQTAAEILRRNGITDVTIQHVPGSLTDHYNPAKKVVNLSDAVYGQTSVAAIGVAAHECGHVIQHHRGYVPLSIRTALVPIANIGSNLGIWIVIASIILGLSGTLTTIGVVLFSFGTLFQIVTLPVEFNASNRALTMLRDYGILGMDEEKKARAVLRAAAMTYVAAAASSLLQLVRLLTIANGRRRR